jgi:hypothetical protein
MKQLLFPCVLVTLCSAAMCAQQSSQQGSYQGTSNPPADDAIVTDTAAPAKPPAGQPMSQAAPAQVQTAGQPQSQAQPQPGSADQDANTPAAATDAGAVSLPPPAVSPASEQPALETRDASADPDGDIVHPRALQPGEIGEGTTIRVKLLDRLSTAETEKGEPFRSQVATDVLQGGQVVLPAGTEIDGIVAEVSSGHAGGSGSIRLRPETVILADGTRFELRAEITGTPGSNTHVVGEGTIKPDSRWKRDGIEYGGGVGAGVVTGAVLGGPVGALTGGLVGAGLVTTHLLVSHPQATLEPGTTLLFTLTEPLIVSAPNTSGN